MAAPFAGIIPALVTPFAGDGALAVQKVGALVERLIGEGASGFYVGGSTGECFLMSLEERKRLFAAAVEAARGRARVICHVGAIATAHAVELARFAESVRADAVSSVPPFYYKFTLAEIKGHYHALMEAAGLPLIIYNIPALSGVTISLDNSADLLADPRIGGVKHTSSDFYQLERIKHRFPHLAVLNGYDEMFLAGLAMGADGAIGSTYNLMTPRFVRIRELAARGALGEARELQRGANDFIAVLLEVGVFPAIKYALRCRGIDAGECRAPFAPLGGEQKRRVDAALERLG